MKCVSKLPKDTFNVGIVHVHFYVQGFLQGWTAKTTMEYTLNREVGSAEVTLREFLFLFEEFLNTLLDLYLCDLCFFNLKFF